MGTAHLRRLKHAERGGSRHAALVRPSPATNCPHQRAKARDHHQNSPRLNLLSPPPPAQQPPANAVHIRVTATLHPAKGKQPPKAAWAIAVEDLDEAARVPQRACAMWKRPQRSPPRPPTARAHPACQWDRIGQERGEDGTLVMRGKERRGWDRDRRGGESGGRGEVRT